MAVSSAPSSCSQYRLPCSCLLNLEIPHDERTERYRTIACPTPSHSAVGNWSQVHLTLTEMTCCGKETPPPSTNSTANTPWGNSFPSQQWGLTCGLHGSGQEGTGVTDAAPCAGRSTQPCSAPRAQRDRKRKNTKTASIPSPVPASLLHMSCC